MRTALILAGHGSHISPHTAGVVWECVDWLRQRGAADEVTAGFWKEAPPFRQVLATVTAEQIVVVPVFTAAGFFSGQVIPSEMALAGPVTQRDGRTITLTRTLGQHPGVPDLVRERALTAIRRAGLHRDETAVAVIGHGTPRSRTTRETTRQQVEAVRQAGIAREVVEAYLDDDPDIPSIYTRTSAPHVIAVPFFLAPGSHAVQDVPEALGIAGAGDPGESPVPVSGRLVHYTPPLGTPGTVDAALCRLILDLARESGLPFPQRPGQRPWDGFPQAGAAALIDAVVGAGELVFGDLHLTPTAVQPAGSRAAVILRDPAALRQHVRQRPVFRPLATGRDLPRDWVTPVDDPQDLPAVVETVYPGALADWAANRRGSFQPETLAATGSRLLYRALREADDAAVAHTVEQVCSGCVRQPTWYTGSTPAGAVPCAAPCNIWLSDIKEGFEA